jgi:hypothetical protein
MKQQEHRPNNENCHEQPAGRTLSKTNMFAEIGMLRCNA